MDLTVKRRNYGADDQSWLGSAHGTNAARTITVDVTTFTAATHYPDGYLKSGLPLSQRENGSFGLAEEGKLDGFLFTPVAVPDAAATPVGAALFEHGRVRSSRLPVAVTVEQEAAASHIIFVKEA